MKLKMLERSERIKRDKKILLKLDDFYKENYPSGIKNSDEWLYEWNVHESISFYAYDYALNEKQLKYITLLEKKHGMFVITVKHGEPKKICVYSIYSFACFLLSQKWDCFMVDNVFNSNELYIEKKCLEILDYQNDRD